MRSIAFFATTPASRTSPQLLENELSAYLAQRPVIGSPRLTTVNSLLKTMSARIGPASTDARCPLLFVLEAISVETVVARVEEVTKLATLTDKQSSLGHE